MFILDCVVDGVRGMWFTEKYGVYYKASGWQLGMSLTVMYIVYSEVFGW